VLSKSINSGLAWLRLLSTTAVWQTAIAAIGFAGGIAVVRLLDVEQYAIYTIANSLLGALIVLGDSGVSSGVTAQGGALWQSKKKLGSVITTGLRISWWFAVVAAVAAVPAGLFLLGKHGASVGASVAVTLILIPSFAIAVRNNILQIPLKLNQDVTALQRTQFVMNAVRLGLLGALLSIAPFAFTALLAATVSTFIANASLLRRSRLHADSDTEPDPVIRTAIMRVVWRMLPGSAYYCIQGQLTIWLISVFGSTGAVAELGALGRLGMITSIIASIVGVVIVPRFARMSNERSPLIRRLVIISSFLALVSTVGVACAALFPSAFLWFLGPSYSHLTNELILVAVSSSLSLLGGTYVNLAYSRGLIPSPTITITISLVAQAFFIFINDVSTLVGVLKMSIGVATVLAVFYMTYLMAKVGKPDMVKSSN
jgi:O-antigen/teichoic acid export membrane protein